MPETKGKTLEEIEDYRLIKEDNMNRLTDKLVICQSFVAEGASVVMCGIETCEEEAGKLELNGGIVQSSKCDIGISYDAGLLISQTMIDASLRS